MPEKRFSIILPTRERAETLIHSLRTCVCQPFESFEIIVADNCSSPETKAVVDSFHSEKIRYFRSETPLSMTDNFERAVSYAEGEFLFALGDDDALLPNALGQLDNLLTALNTKVLHWEHASYFWPGVKGGWPDNILAIPTPTPDRLVDSRKIILDTFESLQYMLLPMLYVNTVVHRSYIEIVKQRTGSFYGPCLSPDSYSGVSIAYLCGSYYSIGRPFSINGTSGKSNGAANLLVRGTDPVAGDYHTLNSMSHRSLHRIMPNLRLNCVAIANEYIQAQDMLFPNDKFMHLDRKRFAVRCVKEMESIKRDDAEWDQGVQEIHRSLTDVPAIQKWFHRKFMSGYERPVVERASVIVATPQDYPSFSAGGISLRGSDFSVSNVADAAELCGKFINPNISTTIDEMHVRANESLYRRARHAARVLIKGS